MALKTGSHLTPDYFSNDTFHITSEFEGSKSCLSSFPKIIVEAFYQIYEFRLISHEHKLNGKILSKRRLCACLNTMYKGIKQFSPIINVLFFL